MPYLLEIMESELASKLANHFLVAMPGMADSNFGGSVVLIAEHNAEGALGVVINRPMEIELSTLFERVELKLQRGELSNEPVFYGGPVHNDRGFVLHRPVGNWNSSVQISDEIALTSSKDVLEAVANGGGPERRSTALAHRRWQPPRARPLRRSVRSHH